MQQRVTKTYHILQDKNDQIKTKKAKTGLKNKKIYNTVHCIDSDESPQSAVTKNHKKTKTIPPTIK